MKKLNKKGLTLIELLAVIAIIAILFVLLIPQINSAIEKARIAGVQTDLHSYEIGIKSHLMENGDEVPTVEKLNKNLDKALQFDPAVVNVATHELPELNGVEHYVTYSTGEESPWKTPYILVVTEDTTPNDGVNDAAVEVLTLDKEPKKHSVKYSDVDNDGIMKAQYYQAGDLRD